MDHQRSLRRKPTVSDDANAPSINPVDTEGGRPPPTSQMASPRDPKPRSAAKRPNETDPLTTRMEQKLLEEFFTPCRKPPEAYTDLDLQRISELLSNMGRPKWATIPRIYTVLRATNQLEHVDVFIQQGITDIWFPFSTDSLPGQLSPSMSTKFLDYQSIVLTKWVYLEKGLDLRHAHFGDDEPLPFKVVCSLGKGGYGSVDKVVSLLSCREFARKKFRRKGMKSKSDIASFKTELMVLKRLRHKHCVELIGSYTDSKCFGMIMSPVADCNLLEFYGETLKSADKMSLMRGFFGCLANALSYLHESKIRHRDIKPSNILIKGNIVYITDFGISHDFHTLTKSTTTADSAKTWLYAAPEVAETRPRNTKADIWSLGCVFLEMATILKGFKLREMRDYFQESSDNKCFYANGRAIPEWVGKLSGVGSEGDSALLPWITDMLSLDARLRPTAKLLFDGIVTYEPPEDDPVSFCGPCCREEPSESEDSADEAWGQAQEELTAATSPPTTQSAKSLPITSQRWQEDPARARTVGSVEEEEEDTPATAPPAMDRLTTGSKRSQNSTNPYTRPKVETPTSERSGTSSTNPWAQHLPRVPASPEPSDQSHSPTPGPSVFSSPQQPQAADNTSQFWDGFFASLTTRPPNSYQEKQQPYPEHLREQLYQGQLREQPYLGQLREQPYPEQLREQPYPEQLRKQLYQEQLREQSYPEQLREQLYQEQLREQPYPEQLREQLYQGQLREQPYLGQSREQPYLGQLREQPYPEQLRYPGEPPLFGPLGGAGYYPLHPALLTRDPFVTPAPVRYESWQPALQHGIADPVPPMELASTTRSFELPADIPPARSSELPADIPPALARKFYRENPHLTDAVDLKERSWDIDPPKLSFGHWASPDSFLQAIKSDRVFMRALQLQHPTDFGFITASFPKDIPKILRCMIRSGFTAASSSNGFLTASAHSPLLLVAAYQPPELSADIIEILLMNGARPDTQTTRGKTPLMAAVKQGNIACVSLLLKFGAPITPQDSGGETALDKSLLRGYESIASILLDHGALPRSDGPMIPPRLITPKVQGYLAQEYTREKLAPRYMQTWTPPPPESAPPAPTAPAESHFPRPPSYSTALNPEPVELPTTAKATKEPVARPPGPGPQVGPRPAPTKQIDFEHVPSFYKPPLPLLTSRNWTGPLYFLEAVISHQALLAVIKDEDEQLHDSLMTTDAVDVTPDTLATTARILMKGGLNINQLLRPSQTGPTPLQYVLEWGSEYKDMFNLMVRHGAIINQQGPDGSTVLTLACSKGNLWAIRYLIDSGINVDEQTGSQLTSPLLCAAEHGQLGAVMLLISRGASIEVRNSHRQTPLLLAAKFGHPSVLRVLLDKGASITARSGHYLPADDLTDSTVLKHAALSGSLETLTILVDAGVPLEESSGDDRDTVLATAASRGLTDVARFLISRNADVNARGFLHGSTPLSKAAAAGHVDMVRLLLSHGADIETEYKPSGIFETTPTPMLLAKANGHREVMALLKEARKARTKGKGGAFRLFNK